MTPRDSVANRMNFVHLLVYISNLSRINAITVCRTMTDCIEGKEKAMNVIRVFVLAAGRRC